MRPGDTLSAIAVALGVPGGWQALYAANRPSVGPDPNEIHPGAVLTIPRYQAPARYTVAPGDTLSAVAASLGVAGGWQALYAANRQVVGPDPNVVRPGTVLVTPRPAVPAASGASQPPRPQPQSAPLPAGQPASQSQPPAPSHAPVPGQAATAPGHPTASAPVGGMPRWLLDVLLTAGILAAAAFAAEPAAVFARRRRQASRSARQASRPGRVRAPGAAPVPADRAAGKAKIILADHERLIVTYCARDHAVYVLTPPGEDPRAVLRAARLVLPEDTYEDLAGHLGVPSAWPLE